MTQPIFGIHAVTNLLLQQPGRIHELWIQQGRDDQKIQRLISLANQHNIPCQTVTKKTLSEKIQGNHQGVLAICEPSQPLNETFLFEQLERLEENALLLILDGVTDPHNLGACLRSAEAAGVHAVIAPKDKSVGLTPTVRKVACGAADITPFIQVTNLSRTLKKLQQTFPFNILN